MNAENPYELSMLSRRRFLQGTGVVATTRIGQLAGIGPIVETQVSKKGREKAPKPENQTDLLESVKSKEGVELQLRNVQLAGDYLLTSTADGGIFGAKLKKEGEEQGFKPIVDLNEVMEKDPNGTTNNEVINVWGGMVMPQHLEIVPADGSLLITAYDAHWNQSGALVARTLVFHQTEEGIQWYEPVLPGHIPKELLRIMTRQGKYLIRVGSASTNYTPDILNGPGSIREFVVFDTNTDEYTVREERTRLGRVDEHFCKGGNIRLIGRSAEGWGIADFDIDRPNGSDLDTNFPENADGDRWKSYSALHAVNSKKGTQIFAASWPRKISSFELQGNKLKTGISCELQPIISRLKPELADGRFLEIGSITSHGDRLLISVSSVDRQSEYGVGVFYSVLSIPMDFDKSRATITPLSEREKYLRFSFENTTTGPLKVSTVGDKSVLLTNIRGSGITGIDLDRNGVPAQNVRYFNKGLPDTTGIELLDLSPKIGPDVLSAPFGERRNLSNLEPSFLASMGINPAFFEKKNN